MPLLWSYLKQYKRLLIAALVLATVNQFFSLLDPQIFRILVDQFASKVHELPRDIFLRGVILLLFGVVGVALVSRVAKNFQDYYVNVMSQRIGAALYGRSVAHSFLLPYAVFEDQRSGELLQKLQKARTDIQLLLVGAINILFLSLVGMLFVLVYAFFVHWLIGILFTLIVPALGFAIFLISKRIRTMQKAIVKETASLAGSTTETLRNVELVKSLGLEQQEIQRLNTVNDQILALELKKVRYVRMLSFVQGTLVNGLRSLLMFLMLWLIAEGAITLGEFFSLLFYSFFLFNPLQELGTVVSYYQEARASSEQLGEILAIPPEKKPEQPVTFPNLESIEFRDVHFAYQTDGKTALAGINLTIKRSETIALVGPSGSGKSTIVKLLVGLYRPTSGTLLINGVDGSSVDYDTFRSRIGFVAQETQLFAGTIRENLLFVRPFATDEECLRVLHAASATSIIERGGKGLDTKIGEGGVKLSGGERQRLAIARALLRNPELIIFDEATSSLDSITEKAITSTMREITTMRTHATTILVAHRLSTIMHAERIYVLEKGRIVEEGTHGELLSRGGLYAALWREQSASAENGAAKENGNGVAVYNDGNQKIGLTP